MGKNPKKSKYSDEIRKIQQLSTINKVLKKGDVENAFLNIADRDSENTGDNAVELMLADLHTSTTDSRDIEVLNALTKGSSPTRKTSARPKSPARKASRPKKKASRPKPNKKRKR